MGTKIVDSLLKIALGIVIFFLMFFWLNTAVYWILVGHQF